MISLLESELSTKLNNLDLTSSLKLTEKQNEIYNNIKNSSDNFYITGFAGTGKSFLLKYICKNLSENPIIPLAPTGIAAINIDGKTIHSQFRIDPSITHLEFFKTSNKNYKLSNYFKNIINYVKKNKKSDYVETIVLDEISMISDYLLDIIYFITIKYLSPYFKVRFIIFGDFLQLGPVEGKYAFESTFSWKKLELKKIELTENIRNENIEFNNQLYSLRSGIKSKRLANYLNKFSIDKITLEHNDYIFLFSTNTEKEFVNNSRYKMLNSDEFSFKAKEYGDFKYYKELKKRVPESISLKKDCRVMMMKNESITKKKNIWIYSNDNKDYIMNGDIGTIIDINKEKVLVKFDRLEEPVLIKHTTWCYFETKLTKSTEDKSYKLIQELKASYSQMPLCLAFAIRMHKSQGLSLDKLIINCNNVFAYSQLYVALSRAKNIRNLYLLNFNINHFLNSQILADPKVLKFLETFDESF